MSRIEIWYFFNIAKNEENTWRRSLPLRILVCLCSCLLLIILGFFILTFFFFFGCAFEFVNYYLTDSPEESNESRIEEYQNPNNDVNNSTNRNIRNNEIQIVGGNEIVKKNAPNDSNACNTKKILMCILIACIGLLCQPLYLIFYLLIGMMECYRRFACWYFYF